MLFVVISYLGWFAKLGWSGGRSIGTPVEFWRFAEFPFAILLLSVNLRIYELVEQAYIIDHQYRQNIATRRWFPAVSWLSFVVRPIRVRADGQTDRWLLKFMRTEMTKLLNITCKYDSLKKLLLLDFRFKPLKWRKWSLSHVLRYRTRSSCFEWCFLEAKVFHILREICFFSAGIIVHKLLYGCSMLYQDTWFESNTKCRFPPRKCVGTVYFTYGHLIVTLQEKKEKGLKLSYLSPIIYRKPSVHLYVLLMCSIETSLKRCLAFSTK